MSTNPPPQHRTRRTPPTWVCNATVPPDGKTDKRGNKAHVSGNREGGGGAGEERGSETREGRERGRSRSAESKRCYLRLFFEGGVALQSEERLPRVGQCTGRWLVGRTRDLADSSKTWRSYMHIRRPWGNSQPPKDQRIRVEIALWSTAAKKSGKWYRGVVEAAERFMVRWHQGGQQEEWKETRPRNRGRGGTRRGVRETAGDENSEETAGRQGGKAPRQLQ